MAKKDEKPVESENFDFEEAMEKLEELVSSMEEGDLSLEKSLEAFEKGVKLTRECQTALANAEQKVKKLLDDAGNTEELTFDELDED